MNYHYQVDELIEVYKLMINQKSEIILNEILIGLIQCGEGH